MSDWIFDNIVWLLAVLFVGLFVGIFQLSKANCYSSWEYSGLNVDWGPLKGCIVQTPNGRWLPADSLRDMDLNPKESK